MKEKLTKKVYKNCKCILYTSNRDDLSFEPDGYEKYQLEIPINKYFNFNSEHDYFTTNNLKEITSYHKVFHLHFRYSKIKHNEKAIANHFYRGKRN